MLRIMKVEELMRIAGENGLQAEPMYDIRANDEEVIVYLVYDFDWQIDTTSMWLAILWSDLVSPLPSNFIGFFEDRRT